MDRAKLLILLMVTAITALAWAGIASAATFTSPAGSAYEGKFHATSQGHVTVHSAVGKVECASTLGGEAKVAGGGEPIGVPLSSLSFSGCTNGWTATVNSPGKLEIHSITGSNNGTVTWSGATVTFSLSGINCLYKAEATDIGTLTASNTTEGTATIDISAFLTRHGGSFFCGGSIAEFTGSYKVQTPDYLDVDA